MNLKYYLRGLGAGIVLTAIIVSIAADNQKEKLSDAEIKARATELGMVEKSSGLLSELENEATTSPSPIPEATTSPSPIPEATTSPSPIPEATTSPSPIPTEQPSDTPVIIEVKAGDSSYAVCKRLEEEGLIASASDFDIYLCDKGLDKRLRAGVYEISEDATPEEIAKILTF